MLIQELVLRLQLGNYYLEKTSGPSDKEVDSEEASESAVVVAVTESPLNENRLSVTRNADNKVPDVKRESEVGPAINYFEKLFSENALFLYDSYLVLTIVCVMLFWVIIFYDMIGDIYGIVPGFFSTLSANILLLIAWQFRKISRFIARLTARLFPASTNFEYSDSEVTLRDSELIAIRPSKNSSNSILSKSN